MEIQPPQRLRKLPPYLFADLRRRIAAARERGAEVISLGIGDPDIPTPDPVVEELCRAVRDESDPDRHRYGCDRPVEELPEAFREFYRHRFGVHLAAEQTLPTMGAKDAIAKFALAVLNPGDLAIAPCPGYPTYNIGHVFAGAVTYQVPLLAENDFLVDFDAIPAEVRRLARVLWLNYPNNPTTATAPLEFFERAVEFGRANDILIAHDAAYTENTYDGYEAPSILQVEGAEEVAVELFSLSKALCMTGWRVGCLAGNRSAVAALRTVKENIDNGTMRPVQFAAAKALAMAGELIPPINAVYRRRRDMVVEALNAGGWDLEPPKGTIYVWAPVPDSCGGQSGEFARRLLEEAGVVVTPGRGYGQWGEGFFRISLTYPDEVIEQAVGRIAEASI
ncbi:MAG: aminotransferase class I/II-fold pyridoxal phosphate-dependent enzyme [Candidatus Brocadiia bacterium]